MKMNSQWRDVESCDFCGSKKSHVILDSDVPKWYTGRNLRILQCDKCTLAYASPRPDADDLYDTYLAGTGKTAEILERKLSRPDVIEKHRKHVDQAQKYLEKKAERLFDMGCGAGTIMLAAKGMGIEAHGNDVNKTAVDWLNTQGVKAQHAFTQDLRVVRNSMDIVINLDYLEHTYTPCADLKKSFDMLRPGGILYLKTLYLGCPDHIEKGEAWQLFGCGHFHYFTPEVLQRMVKAAGFEIIDTKQKALLTIIGRKPDSLLAKARSWCQKLAA